VNPSNQPTIFVSPQTTQVDERVTVRLSGFAPSQVVKLRVHMDSILGLPCDAESEVTFQADESGDIDLDKQAPISGTYDAADAMGVFWSMQMANVRFHPTRRNLEFTYEPQEAIAAFAAEVDGRVVATTECIRRFVDPQVTMQTVTEPGIIGKFFFKEGAAPAPAILVLGGGEGGLAAPMTLAGLLASHGYPALALAYFNFEDLPNELREIPLEFFATSLEWLKKHPCVRDGQIGVFGRSKGAELALLLGATYPEVGAVIASSPSSVVCIGAMKPRDDGEFDTYSSWSNEGTPLPFAPWSAQMCREANEKLRGLERIDDIHLQGLLDGADRDEIAIPVENTRAPILLISSGDDHWWPATLHSHRLMERLQENQFTYEVEHLDYPSAGHGIRFPYIPMTQLRMNGGTPEANHHASLDSWKHVLDFLERSFPAG
jgi:dienelactone hydrolase